MTQEHPITPPPELVQQWHDAWFSAKVDYVTFPECVATQAARWGADQELEACVTEISFWGSRSLAEKVRAARRPKPLSLKEQALLAIDTAVADGRLSPDVSNVVRRALEQLDD